MSKIAKATLGLMIATLLSKVLGFTRELVLASTYGTSLYSDAYLVASSIPTTVFSIIVSGLGTTVIPIYYEIKKNCEERANKFIINITNIVIIISIMFAIIGIIFTKPLVEMFAIGFKGEQLEMTIYFTKILIIGVIFIGITNIMTIFLQIKNEFKVPGLIGIPYNIIIIVSIILSSKYGIYLLAYGTLLAMSSQWLFQLFFAKKKGYKYKLYINLKDEYIKKIIKLLIPVFIGVGVVQINVIVDKTIASTLAEGMVSALNYANKLTSFIMTLFISAITSVIFPLLASLNSIENKQKFNKIIINSANMTILLILPISIGAIVLARPIVSILFERGQFDINATNSTAIALAFYAIGMIGFALRDVFIKVFYSIQDTKTPIINGSIAMIINIVLNIILVNFMGHEGLAFATSISAIISIFLLANSLKNKIGYFGQDKIISVTIKAMIASVIMGIFVYIIYDLVSKILPISDIYNIISLAISVIIGFIIYCISITMLKVEEINMIINIFNEKIKYKRQAI